MNEDIIIPPVREDGLQLEEHRRLQEWFWTVQRVCWIGFGLISVIALLGFAGSGGPFQKQQIEFASGVVEVPRISRWEGSDDMIIRFEADAGARDISITQPFFDRFMIERIQPEPAENLIITNGQSMRFAHEGAPPHLVDVSVRSMHFGWTRFDLTMGGETKTVSLLVLP